jgi:hypothetical protein
VDVISTEFSFYKEMPVFIELQTPNSLLMLKHLGGRLAIGRALSLAFSKTIYSQPQVWLPWLQFQD